MRRHSLIAALGAILLAAPAFAQMPGGPMGPAGPTDVGVVTMQPQAVPVSAELAGRVSASKVVEIRPQVGGIIKAIDFKDGATVKAGDVLYEIDDASYKAQVDVAKATLEKDQAGVTSAQAKYDRYLKLGANVSQSDLEDARIALVQAQADAASASASLQAAQINLDYTTVKAPISGLISESAVTQGALVTAAQATALATVRLLDPIYVDLVETSANLIKIRAQFAAGNLKGEPESGKPVIHAPVVHLTLEDGSTYPETGELTLANVVVSEFDRHVHPARDLRQSGPGSSARHVRARQRRSRLEPERLPGAAAGGHLQRRRRANGAGCQGRQGGDAGADH